MLHDPESVAYLETKDNGLFASYDDEPYVVVDGGLRIGCLDGKLWSGENVQLLFSSLKLKDVELPFSNSEHYLLPDLCLHRLCNVPNSADQENTIFVESRVSRK